MKRAQHFPSMIGLEKMALGIYQLSTIAIFATMPFLETLTNKSFLLYTGIAIYIIGLALLILSIISFSKPSNNGINQVGLYRLSRNPMYVAYFFCFIGISLLVQSFILIGNILVFQISAHWVILSEERWCIEQFGQEYLLYMDKVRRYL